MFCLRRLAWHLMVSGFAMPMGARTDAEAAGIERIVALPDSVPALVEKPFAESTWKESLAVPPGKHRLRADINIGEHGGGTSIYLLPGGEYSLAKGKFHVWGGRLYAQDCRFKDIPFRADHTGGYWFAGCRLENCSIQEEGTWYGFGNFDSVWYFENCLIDRYFVAGGINVHWFGLCMIHCTLRGLALPVIWFNGGEPTDLRKETWFTVRNCRFEKCDIPLTFLMATSDCAFINCQFIGDLAGNNFSKAVEVTFFTSACKSKIKEMPPTVTLKERPLAELQAPYGSLLGTD